MDGTAPPTADTGRRRGRPPGSKNKPKDANGAAGEHGDTHASGPGTGDNISSVTTDDALKAAIDSAYDDLKSQKQAAMASSRANATYRNSVKSAAKIGAARGIAKEDIVDHLKRRLRVEEADDQAAEIASIDRAIRNGAFLAMMDGLPLEVRMVDMFGGQYSVASILEQQRSGAHDGPGASAGAARADSGSEGAIAQAKRQAAQAFANGDQRSANPYSADTHPAENAAWDAQWLAQQSQAGTLAGASLAADQAAAVEASRVGGYKQRSIGATLADCPYTLEGPVRDGWVIGWTQRDRELTVEQDPAAPPAGATAAEPHATA